MVARLPIKMKPAAVPKTPPPQQIVNLVGFKPPKIPRIPPTTERRPPKIKGQVMYIKAESTASLSVGETPIWAPAGPHESVGIDEVMMTIPRIKTMKPTRAAMPEGAAIPTFVLHGMMRVFHRC
jgi:hypothetical protein